MQTAEGKMKKKLFRYIRDNFDKLYGGEGFDILSIADLKIGGPNPPDHPDRCVDNAPQFEVICDDDL